MRLQTQSPLGWGSLRRAWGRGRLARLSQGGQQRGKRVWVEMEAGDPPRAGAWETRKSRQGGNLKHPSSPLSPRPGHWIGRVRTWPRALAPGWLRTAGDGSCRCGCWGPSLSLDTQQRGCCPLSEWGPPRCTFQPPRLLRTLRRLSPSQGRCRPPRSHGPRRPRTLA